MKSVLGVRGAEGGQCFGQSEYQESVSKISDAAIGAPSSAKENSYLLVFFIN